MKKLRTAGEISRDRRHHQVTASRIGSTDAEAAVAVRHKEAVVQNQIIKRDIKEEGIKNMKINTKMYHKRKK